MSIYVNPGNESFRQIVIDEIYVDKTNLISFTNDRINKSRLKYICVSRPRRFGKSMAADMLIAYYSCGCDSSNLFSGRKAEQEPSFQTHLNQHNVIRLDIQRFLESEYDFNTFIYEIEKTILLELINIFPNCTDLTTNIRLKNALEKIFDQTKKGFIFIIDEWDCVFRLAKEQKKIQKHYLDFLRGLFKGAEYIELAYMTGILPIKKYGEHSAINIFKEYSILNSGQTTEYFGFTELEVKNLCIKHNIDFNKTKNWYDGYLLGNQHIYNPQAVTELIDNGEFQNYWTKTETYEALKIYIDQNFNGLRESIIAMLGNSRCKIDPTTFQNDMTTFKVKDDILTLLVHLGYLTYDKNTNEVFIPNQEIAQEFIRTIKVGGWDSVIQALIRSEELLKRTLAMDEAAVAKNIEIVHNETASILKYNNENSLTCTILLAYYSAKNYYINPIMELPSGKGFADIVYLPKRNINYPALIIELKWKQSAKGAIEQIKNKQYAN